MLDAPANIIIIIIKFGNLYTKSKKRYKVTLLCTIVWNIKMKENDVKRRMHSEHDKIWEHSSTESSGCVKYVMRMSHHNCYFLSSN